MVSTGGKYVIFHALAHADTKVNGVLRATMARSAYGLVDVEELLGIFDDLGSVKYAADMSEKHAALARARLRPLPGGEPMETLVRVTEWLEARWK